MVTALMDEEMDLMRSRFLSAIIRISPAATVKLNG
jgi:RNA:NAD 2'-phosphotransferase (TPT1/KptA family)